jgi:hypothetical protein
MSHEVKNQTNVVNRKGSDVYHYRARIPVNLQKHFGKAKRWVSLRTKDPHFLPSIQANLTVCCEGMYTMVYGTLR